MVNNHESSTRCMMQGVLNALIFIFNSRREIQKCIFHNLLKVILIEMLTYNCLFYED